jgi:hypothetical protein
MPGSHVKAGLGERTWNEPSAIDVSAIGALHKPPMPLFVKTALSINSTPFLTSQNFLDMLEVSA